MKMCRAVSWIVAIMLAAVFHPLANAQSASDSATPNQTQTQSQSQSPTPQHPAQLFSSRSATMQFDLAYHRPTEREKLKTYAFDAVGPYAFLGSAFSAGIAQYETADKAHNAGIP